MWLKWVWFWGKECWEGIDVFYRVWGGMRGTTPYSSRGCEPPAPLLSFSCVKKKDGGERKSLRGTIRRAWGDTPHWKNVAAPRSTSPIEEIKPY